MRDTTYLKQALKQLTSEEGTIEAVKDEYKTFTISGTYKGKALKIVLSASNIALDSILSGCKAQVKMDISYNGNVMIGNGTLSEEAYDDTKQIIRESREAADKGKMQQTRDDWNELMEDK